MTINFMVLGGPRSGTTWAANWLTTESTVCLHDPFLEYTLAELSQLYFPNKRLGISCTAAMLHPKWVNSHSCPKIMLYRQLSEINASLRELGLVELGEMRHLARIDALKGVKILPYEQLFHHKSAKAIAEYLGVPFDHTRFAVLRQMRVEPMWRHLTVGKRAVTELLAQIKEAR